jgi:broad specificity phosphatase PhoE
VTNPLDVARNAKALRNLAALIDSWGLGDAHNRAEHIARRLTADGWRAIEPTPPLRQPAELDGDGYREFQAAKARLKEKR